MRGASALLLLLAALAGLRGADAQIIETPETKVIPKLTVKGEAELRRAADLLRISIGVVNEGPEATAALDENNRRMASVEKAIMQAGLQKNEFETGRFRIRPLYSRRPRQAEPEWRPEIEGYEVSNSLNVRTGKLELAGLLITAAGQAGANEIDAITFDLADRRTCRADVISEAARNARADAAALAGAAGVRLRRLLSIHLDDFTPVPVVRGRAAAAAADAAPAPITPGDVTLTASVTLVYEIVESEEPAAPTSAPGKEQEPPP